jgi:hypothetical protein
VFEFEIILARRLRVDSANGLPSCNGAVYIVDDPEKTVYVRVGCRKLR